MLFGYNWDGSKTFKGHKIYFVREIAEERKGKNQGNKIQGKSNKKINSWKTDMLIYRNISYDSLGKFSMQPRIWQGSRQYFGKRGSIKFIVVFLKIIQFILFFFK